MTDRSAPPPDLPRPAFPSDVSGDMRRAIEALEAFRASEARYRALVEASTRMVWRTDPAGAVDDMPFWRELTGQTLEQVRGAGWVDAVHPADRARVWATWERARDTRTVYEAEYRLRHADGSYHWYRARGAAVRDSSGEIREWVGVFNDIGDERRERGARELLERASEALVSAEGVRDSLGTVARLAVARLTTGDAFADGAAIDLPRPGGGFERVAVACGDPAREPLVQEMARRHAARADAPAGYPSVIRTGMPELHAALPPTLVNTVAGGDEHARMLQSLDLYSSIVVPLRARGATMGALTLVLMGPDRRRAFDARDLAVAEELARRAALALDNAQRWEAEQAAAVRARRLLAVVTGLGRARTPEEVADVIFNEGLAALGADAGSLALVHEHEDGRREFEIVRIHGYRAELAQAYHRFPLHAGRPLSDAVLAGVPILLETRAEWEARYREMYREAGDLGYEGFAAIPIISNGRAIAGISVSFVEPLRFDEATRTFLATLGEQCGLALARAQAFASVRRAEQGSAFLAEASALLTESLDFETTLRAVAEAAVPRLGDWCTVHIVRDPVAGAWPPPIDRVAMVYRDPAKQAIAREIDERYPIDYAAQSGRAMVLRDGRSLLVPAVTDESLVANARDADHLRLLRAMDLSALIMVPLTARGLTLGTLTLGLLGNARHYDVADLSLAEDLAHRAAVAVDNARLFRAAEHAREDAEAANLAKSQFLSTMSHELRTPLNAITGYVDLLDMELRGPVTDAQREDLSRIRRSAKVLMSLVNDVLNFARLEAGQVEVNLRNVRLADVLGELKEIVAPQVQAKRLTFACTASDDAVAHADAERVEQILTNLLTNAIKFTEPGGRVTVTAGREVTNGVARAWVRVSDTGRGIATDQLEQIFEPFVQVDRHLTHESQQGVGLGLAISRDLARLMGGELSVESEVGQGSTFTLTLRGA